MSFIGRDKELAIVRAHLCAGSNLVVSGPTGIGKTALVRNALRDSSVTLYCPDTSTLKHACQSLLSQLNLSVPESDNVLRKRAILQAIDGKNYCFIFDHVEWVGPRLLSFFERVRESHSIIVVTRSVAPSDTGHLKMILWDFDNLDLAPLSREKTRQVLCAWIKEFNLSVPDPQQFEADALRIAGHNLHVLRELCQQAVNGRYIFGKHLSAPLVNLDRRIKELRLP